MKLWDYLRDGGKRAVAIWHRRCGKDEVCLHHCAVSATLRVGNYAYCLPEYSQGRKAIWNAVNPHSGLRRIDEAFPLEMRASTQDQEMLIRTTNGSTIQIIGSDTYNTSVVGTSYAGIVFSEFALANPSAWAYARPVLEENDGWAIFITTPRGRNHAYEMYKHAEQSPDWFCETLTAHDTGALTEQQLAEALKEYRAWGARRGALETRIRTVGEWPPGCNLRQITKFAPRPHLKIEPLPVRASQLGPRHRDGTCVWFWQVVEVGFSRLRFGFRASPTGGATRSSKSMPRGWRHGNDYVPHDAKVRELSTGRTRVETMRQLGLNPILAPDASLQDGINAVRRTLPLCVFHPRCEDTGIAALEQYRRELDDEKKCFRASPLHDWCSDRVDSFRYLALSWKPAPRREVRVPQPTGWRIPPPPEPRRGEGSIWQPGWPDEVCRGS